MRFERSAASTQYLDYRAFLGALTGTLVLFGAMVWTSSTSPRVQAQSKSTGAATAVPVIQLEQVTVTATRLQPIAAQPQRVTQAQPEQVQR